MSPRRTPRRYWDANTFIGFFNNEPDKVAACQTVLKAAQAGSVQIVTSAVTLAEVIKVKGQPRLKREAEETIRDFFKHSWIVIVECDRTLAVAARQLMWDHEFLDHKDAIHVATAIRAGVSQLDTFDEPLCGISGKIGNPPLAIGHPNLVEQIEMGFDQAGSDLEDEEGADDDEEET